jgi:putative peptidoglycan lipid II flippase
VAALLNAALLYRGLRRDDVIQHAPGWQTLLGRIALANVAMWAVLAWLNRPLEWWLQTQLTGRAGWLTVSVVAGAGAYFLVLLLLGLRPGQFSMRRK